ncbi:hypothetical protein D3C80_1542420 [compost metagenome]
MAGNSVFSEQCLPDEGTNHCSRQRGGPEQPKLTECCGLRKQRNARGPGRIDGCIRDRNRHQVYQRQAETNRDRRKAGWSKRRRGAEDYNDEEGRKQNFGNQRRDQPVATGGKIAVSV